MSTWNACTETFTSSLLDADHLHPTNHPTANSPSQHYNSTDNRPTTKININKVLKYRYSDQKHGKRNGKETVWQITTNSPTANSPTTQQIQQARCNSGALRYGSHHTTRGYLRCIASYTNNNYKLLLIPAAANPAPARQPITPQHSSMLVIKKVWAWHINPALRLAEIHHVTRIRCSDWLVRVHYCVF